MEMQRVEVLDSKMAYIEVGDGDTLMGPVGLRQCLLQAVGEEHPVGHGNDFTMEEVYFKWRIPLHPKKAIMAYLRPHYNLDLNKIGRPAHCFDCFIKSMEEIEADL